MSRSFPESERRRLLAKIHIAKTQLGWDEDQYRGALMDVAGVDSAAKLTVKGFKLFLDYLYRCGFKDGAPKGKRLSPKAGSIKTRKDKCVALWIKLYKAGKVKDRSHDALCAYVRRFMPEDMKLLPGVDAIDAATPKQLAKCIAALEGWLDGPITGTEATGDPIANSEGSAD